ncbi:hypothetical protein J5N97_003485 [Dioscorea zingiberensis]|uniref:Uncharacterized protein n=1 Tax=Dioscorea zingiberensis TaxID=325984 RepID=A0A9D5HQF6_9LILI|nr:hypothetical protein J5N97_003485 [Dioscorea zingiberensis]
MVSEAVVGELLLLAPIRTTVTTTEEKHVEVSPEECVTPKSEECALKPALVCPPAPRKPRPMKRKSRAASRGFFAVPHDLSSVFLALPEVKKKRIRVG